MTQEAIKIKLGKFGDMFLTDFFKGETINVNGVDASRSLVNLIITNRDLKLWRIGMKPTSSWKVSAVKQYYGFKGNKEKLVTQSEELIDLVKKFIETLE